MYLIFALLVSTRLKFHPIFLYDQTFLRYKVVDNRKCTKWPQTELAHLTVKSTLHRLITNLRCQIFVRFTLRPAGFKIQGCRKSKSSHGCRNQSRKCTKWPPNDFEHYKIKGTPYTCYQRHRVPCFTTICSFHPFSRYVVNNRKTHRMTSDWFWTFNSTYPRGPHFRPFGSTARNFQNTRLLKIGNFGNIPNNLRLGLKA